MAAKKIALFIDADNISARYGKQIFAAVEGRGEVFIRRIYGNWEKNSLHGWNDCILNFSLRAVQQPDFVTGKNATDMSLTIDAMDVLHEGEAEIFALVSNDSDFTPLVIRLREGGRMIIGLGNANASNAFRAACNEFIDLDAPAVQKPVQKPKTPATHSAAQNSTPPVQMSLFAENPAPEVKPAPVTTERPASPKVVSITRATAVQNADKLRAIHDILHETARIHADKKGFVAMCWAGQSIHNQLGFSVKDFGYGSLYKFVSDFPDLYEVIHRDNGDNFCYRCRVNKPRPAPVESSPVESRLQKFHAALHEAATTCADDKGFANLCTVGTFLNHKEIGFGVKSLGYGTLQKFISAFPDRYELRKSDKKVFIRCITDDERVQKPHNVLRETAAANSDDSGLTDDERVQKLQNVLHETAAADSDDSSLTDDERVQKPHNVLRETAAADSDDSSLTDDERAQKLHNVLRETVAANSDDSGLTDDERAQKLHNVLRETAAANSDDSDLTDDERVQKLHNVLRETAAARADDSGFTDLSYVGNSLGKQKIGFGIRSLGYGTLQKFVADFPDRYELRKTDKKVFYRCRANESTAPVDNRLNQLHDILREAATAQHDDEGFSLLNHAGQKIKNKHLNFSIRDFGYGQLREFVSAFPDRYEVAHDTNGGKFRYRCKPTQK